MLKRFIKKITEVLFLILEYLVPKDERIIIFGSRGGMRYCDNSRYIFEYYIKYSDYNVYWLTRSDKVYNWVDNKFSGRVLHIKSIKSLWLFLKAKTVIVSSDHSDVSPYYLTPIRKNVILLWHGIMIKRCGFIGPKSQLKWIKEVSKNTNIMISSSQVENLILASCFHIHTDSIWLTGYPRNDAFFYRNELMEQKYPFLKKKIILYAPTYRPGEKVALFFPFSDLNFSKVIETLEKYDAYILLRGHSREVKNIFKNIKFDFRQEKRIIIADQEKFPDVNDIVPYVNVLITDYSGIYFDFLLLNRPIIFIPYDYEEYRKTPGFTLEYMKYTPGPKVSTQKDFIRKLNEYLENPSLDSDERRKIRDIFHTYQDGKSCERIFNKISELVNMENHLEKK